MKKAILILAALMMVISGIAAVSAYEAHVINVQAHVENAMYASKTKVEFDTIFPEEWMTANFTVGYSESFCNPDQQGADNITYAVYVEWKRARAETYPKVTGSDNNSYYPWLGNALYIGIKDGDQWTPADMKPEDAGGLLKLVGDPPANCPGAKWVLDCPKPIRKYKPDYNGNDIIMIGLDAPVFEAYYNPLTDAIACDPTKPSGLNEPSWVIPEFLSDNVTPNPLHDPEGVDLGLDIKIQITDINRWYWGVK
jgi:hypothetical protein